MILDVRNLNITMNDQPLVTDLSFGVDTGEIVGMQAPSGRGKTTLLRALAGFHPYTGQVLFDEQDIANIKPEARQFGYVQQESTLFPHLTVAENIGYGLRVRGVNETDRLAQVQNIADDYQIADTLDRLPQELSGGQQQRVAIARTLITDPVFLMLDEPFRSLDVEIKNHLLEWLQRVIKKRALPTLFVTHDALEADRFADHIFPL